MRNDSPTQSFIAALERHGCTVRPDGAGWRSNCPSHAHSHGNRNRPALSISEGHDGRVLVNCHAGCAIDAVLDPIGLQSGDLFPSTGATPPAREKKPEKRLPGLPPGEIGKTLFPYPTADDKPAIAVYRYTRDGGKCFAQYAYDGQGWIKGLGAWKERLRPLYRLPTIKAAGAEGFVVFHEGEKAVEAAIKAGLGGIHTTTIGGAGNAHKSDFSPLRGRGVVIVPDNDEPGEKHAQSLVRLAYGAGARAVRIVRLPGLPPKGDVVEWLEAGGDDARWFKLVKDAETIDPERVGTTQQAHKSGPNEADSTWDDPQPLPSALLPVDAFNPDLLPSPFRAFVVDVAERMQCPVDYPAAAIMVSLGSLIGRRCAIHPKAHDDWLVVPNLWGGLIGRPSLMKSPAMQQALRPLDALITRARETYAQQVDEFEALKIAHDARMKQWKEQIGKAAKAGKDPTMVEKPAKPEEPVERRYRTNEGSVECLIQLLNQNPDGLLLMRDELVGWVRGLDRSGREGARQFFLECWNGNGTSFDYDTIAHGHMRCESLCLSVLGTIQPGPLSELIAHADKGGGGDDGLIQRFQLMVYPDISHEWKHVDRRPDEYAARSAVEVFMRLDERLPETLRFDDEGQEVFNAWWRELECRIRREESATVEAHLAKYRSLMPSLALLIHLADVADRHCGDALGDVPPVTGEAAERAVRWCAYLESHARRVYAMGANAGMGAARLLLDRLIEGRVESPFKVKLVQQKGWKGLATTEQVKRAIEVLEMFGWVRMEVDRTGGRPSEICHLHPRAKHFKTPIGDTPVNPVKGGEGALRGLRGSLPKGDETQNAPGTRERPPTATPPKIWEMPQ